MPVSSGPPWAVRVPSTLAQEQLEAWLAYKQARRAEGRNSAAALGRLNTFKGLNRTYRNFSIDSQEKYESNLLSRPDNQAVSFLCQKKKDWSPSCWSSSAAGW